MIYLSFINFYFLFVINKISMSSSKTFQSQSFTPYRPLTTKSIPFSSSIKTNLEANSTKPSTIEHDLFSTVRHENSLLK